MKVIREKEIKVYVSPTFSDVVNTVTSIVTVSTGAFVGTKVAAGVANPLGKAAVIIGYIVATVASKTIVE